MAGRYSKNSGTTWKEPPSPTKPRHDPWRRFKPDFYNPPERPPRPLPNFNPNRPKPGFGKGAGGSSGGRSGPRPIPRHGVGWRGALAYAGFWWTAVELVDGLMMTRPEEGFYKNPPGWYACPYVCYNPPGTWIAHTMYFKNEYWCSESNRCIGAQASGGTIVTFGDDLVYNGSSTNKSLQYRYSQGAVNRGKHYKSWKKDGSNVGPHTWHYMASMWYPFNDPNDDRGSPGPNPFPPAPSSGPAPGSGPPPGGSPPPPSNPPRPSPPGRGTKEQKRKGSLNIILGILDTISEGAELVDAFYDALPEQVKKKWDCGQASRGLIDNAGQYGIDGADCKSRALWHNWHHVDFEQALRNAVANEIQDRVLGGLHRFLPNNVGHGVDGAMGGVNEFLQWFFNGVGLTE